jgi:hypothetical protein
MPGARTLSREQQIREAVLLIVLRSAATGMLFVTRSFLRRVEEAMTWLDVSGLALYLLERMAELHLSSTLPSWVHARLKQNLLDDTERTRGMIAESLAIQQAFQQANLSYATLKGLHFAQSRRPGRSCGTSSTWTFLWRRRARPGHGRFWNAEATVSTLSAAEAGSSR